MHLTGLARVARDAGITVREVPGWQTRTAHKGGMNKVVGVIWHHTATPANAVMGRNNPTLNYMVSGLGYPLANYGLAWDGSLDVISAGTGAHAGKGSYPGVPNNDGNRHMLGIEVEGTTGLTWSPAQLETAARLGAQLNKDFGANLLHIGHLEWAPGRKTDPSGIPGGMNALRAAIQRGYWHAPTIIPASVATRTDNAHAVSQEAEAMATELKTLAADVATIKQSTSTASVKVQTYGGKQSTVTPSEGLTQLHTRVRNIEGKVDNLTALVGRILAEIEAKQEVSN